MLGLEEFCGGVKKNAILSYGLVWLWIIGSFVMLFFMNSVISGWEARISNGTMIFGNENSEREASIELDAIET